MSDHHYQTIYSKPTDTKSNNHENSSQQSSLSRNLSQSKVYPTEEIRTNEHSFKSGPTFLQLQENLAKVRQEALSAKHKQRTTELVSSSPPSHATSKFEPVFTEQESPVEHDYYLFPKIDTRNLNPNQFVVPENLPTFNTGKNPISEIEYFTRQFAITLNAYGLNIDSAWYRLLPLYVLIEV